MASACADAGGNVESMSIAGSTLFSFEREGGSSLHLFTGRSTSVASTVDYSKWRQQFKQMQGKKLKPAVLSYKVTINDKLLVLCTYTTASLNCSTNA